MDIDFKNDFTASLATALFTVVCLTVAIATFIILWASCNSFLLTVILFVLIAPICAIGIGILAAGFSWAVALLVSALRQGLTQTHSR